MSEIAIIGMGCRFPGGADNPDAFWDMLCKGVDATKDVPGDRWNIGLFYHPDKSIPGKTYTCRGGFLKSIDDFDAEFFGISPREAAYLDPQQRLLLETSWEALEDAGLDPAYYAGKDVGVYMGAFTLDYKVIQFKSGNRALVDAHTAAGTMMTMISNRISYCFDFRGPSLSVDTACSSSLVAVHLACQALNNKECTLALAGGVNVIATPDYMIAESKAGFLAPDGRSKAFDSRADGYARGEGAGVVVLKPLKQALADHDSIYGVIKATAVNQDGRTNGITVPRGEAQEALMRKACRKAGISSNLISYIEAHGTGTQVGDPIEVNAIARVLARDRSQTDKCFIGSVKTNVGHLEAAAGIAGIIKSCLILKNRLIPPHLHFHQPNPLIPFEKTCLQVPVAMEALPIQNGSAFIAVNSFGFGGTNAHLLLADAPEQRQAPNPQAAPPQDWPWVLPISAKNTAALKQLVEKYRRFIAAESAPSMGDICYSATNKRTQHLHRLALVFRTREELCQKIDNFLAEENRPGIVAGKAFLENRPKLVFVYTGMGPIWWAMGRQLLQKCSVFREVIDECDRMTLAYAGWSLRAELEAAEQHSRLDQPQYAQPANFSIQAGLTKIWESLGVIPEAVVGHSIGEVGAAYASGALTLEEALKTSIERSRWQQTLVGKGTMLAVGLSEADAGSICEEYKTLVSVAAVNSPRSCTLAGCAQILEQIRAQLDGRGIFARFMKVNVAYHSPQMDSILNRLTDALQFLIPRKAVIPMYSTVTARQAEGSELTADYWADNVRKAVRFQGAIAGLAKEGGCIFIEIGPHPVLNTSIEECLAAMNVTGRVFPTLRRKEDEPITILSTLGSLYAAGYPVDWRRIQPEGRPVKLPHYAWQHDKYWMETQESKEYRLGLTIHPVLGGKLRNPRPTWELEVDVHKEPYLKDHRIQGGTVFPGAGYVELGLACAKEVFGRTECVLENIRFNKAMFLREQDLLVVQTVFDPGPGSVEIFSKNVAAEENWTSHASMTVLSRKGVRYPARISLEALQKRCTAGMLDQAQCYSHFWAKGFQYGENFRGIQQIWLGADEALARIEAPPELVINTEHTLHPALLDACFQSMIVLLKNDDSDAGDVFLPIGIEALTVYRRSLSRMWSHVRLKCRSKHSLTLNLKLLDPEGRMIAEIDSLEVRSLASSGTVAAQSLREWLFSVEWQKQDQAPISEAKRAQERWLILCDKSGFNREVIKAAEARGIHCLPIAYGSGGSATGGLVVNPEVESDFDSLLAEVHGLDEITKIIDLWPLDAELEEMVNADALQRNASLGCVGLLHLLKALTRRGRTPKIWLATRGAQTVEGMGGEKGLLQSSLWGMSRVFGHNEKSDLWGGMIDFDVTPRNEEAGKLVAEVLACDGEDQIAFRGDSRFVLRIGNLDIPAVKPSMTFGRDGSYLITGAFGALGMVVTRWMVKNGARRLVLLGRTEIPERTHWSTLPPDSVARKRTGFILELEALGASVHVANVDIADPGQLEAYLSQYRQEGWPPIRGIIHAAGILRDGVIDNLTADDFKRALAPKVLGAWNLHKAFLHEPLEFFILFSSIASLIAISMGQSNYAAGNAFMDSLAGYRMARGLPALSINWGPWSEVGMAEERHLIEYFKNRGLGPVSPQAGMLVLSALFGTQSAQAVVAPEPSWATVEKAYPTGIGPRMISRVLEQELARKDAAAAQAGSGFTESALDELRKVLPEERATVMERHLKILIAKVLRTDPDKLDTAKPLNAFGLDSMMATEIKLKVKVVFDFNLPLVDLLQGKTIAQLAAATVGGLIF